MDLKRAIRVTNLWRRILKGAGERARQGGLAQQTGARAGRGGDRRPAISLTPTRRRPWRWAFFGLAYGGLAGPTQADWHPMVHTLSPNFDQPAHGQWSAQNWGLGVCKDLGAALSAQAGAYRNSNHENTVYLVADYLPLRHGPLLAGVFGGLVTNDKSPLAGGAPVRIEGESDSAALRLAPKSHAVGSVVVSVEFGTRF